MSALEQYQLAQNRTLQARVQMIAIKAAISVAAEEPTTVNHHNRARFARDVLLRPVQNAELIAYGVTTNVSITDEATDGDIEFTINSLWDAYSGVV